MDPDLQNILAASESATVDADPQHWLKNMLKCYCTVPDTRKQVMKNDKEKSLILYGYRYV
jgi:hypothetical protein